MDTATGRLAPAGAPLTEETFRKIPLEFVGRQGLRWGGGKAKGGAELFFEGTYAPERAFETGLVNGAKGPLVSCYGSITESNATGGARADQLLHQNVYSSASYSTSSYSTKTAVLYSTTSSYSTRVQPFSTVR